MNAPREIGHLTEELHRERVLDMESRLRPVRRRAFGVLAIVIAFTGPQLGFEWLGVLLFVAAAFAFADRQMGRSAHPERWGAIGWSISPAAIAICIIGTGVSDSPATAWLALPAVTLGARFSPRGVYFGSVYIVALLVFVTVGLDFAAVVAEPARFTAPLALILATTILSTAVVESDREHRVSSTVDPLTGLLNRAALGQRFAELDAQARQEALLPSVGFVVGDLDHFKAVNDEHGHATGDAVLKGAAYALRKELRAFDLVYRIGGEEFVILLPGATLEKSAEIADKLREAVAACEPAGIRVTMSFGVALAEAPALDFSDVFERADRALYAAKDAGRDRVVVGGAEVLTPA